MTSRTRDNAAMSVVGSPSTTIRSACLPGWIEPIRSSMPSVRAADRVAAVMACMAVIPPDVIASSSCQRQPKPVYGSPASLPATTFTPAAINSRNASNLDSTTAGRPANRFCSSGLQSIAHAAYAIIAGQIEDAAYQYQQEIESGDRVIVGVNEFQVDEEAEVPVMRVDPAVGDEQVRSLAQVKAERDQEAVRQCLTDLEAAARSGSENLMEPVLAAVRCYCSLGEICDVLRGVFGEYRG